MYHDLQIVCLMFKCFTAFHSIFYPNVVSVPFDPCAYFTVQSHVQYCISHVLHNVQYILYVLFSVFVCIQFSKLHYSTLLSLHHCVMIISHWIIIICVFCRVWILLLFDFRKGAHVGLWYVIVLSLVLTVLISFIFWSL